MYTFVFILAKKYDVYALEQLCYDILKNGIEHMDLKDVLGIMVNARKIYDDICIEMAMEWFDCHAIEFFTSEHLFKIDLDLLIDLLKRDSLFIKEFDLCIAVCFNFKFIFCLIFLGFRMGKIPFIIFKN